MISIYTHKNHVTQKFQEEKKLNMKLYTSDLVHEIHAH